MPSCAIIILNWNGILHLKYLLPSVQAAVARHAAPVSVVVVDNRSTEPDVAWMREHYPNVEVTVAERNDYLFSLNSVVAARKEEVVLLFNNDMRVEPDFIAPLLEYFQDPEVFAVVPKILDWDGTFNTTGPRQAEVHRMRFLYRFRPEVETASHTLDGGVGAFRREYFVALGGYDPLYRPGYWEDVDLGYRAWARGWKCIYEPRSVVYHRVNGTFGEMIPAGRLRQLDIRNQMLFTVKNVGGWSFALAHLAFLILLVIRAWMAGNQDTTLGLLRGVRLLPRALRGRAAQPPHPRRTTRAITAALRRSLSEGTADATWVSSNAFSSNQV
jgi:GT2 family glycosyltransferase